MHKILVVDDSAAMRQMISFTLKYAGFDVIEAVDGEDGFQKAINHDFKLVLTEQNMPGLDGISLTKQLRADTRYKHIPIFILTNEDSEQMKRAGSAAGATSWLIKPFNPTKLVALIKKFID